MSDEPIRVKVTTSFPTWPLMRQTPGGSGTWGKYRFVPDTDPGDCDFWVFYEAPWTTMRAQLDREDTVFISAEPPTIRHYPQGYLDQFGTVIMCQPGVKHRDVRFMQQGQPWYFGAWHGASDPARTPVLYDQLKALDTPKPKVLSIVSSNLNRTRGHAARLAFATELKNRLGDRVELFGRGIRPFADKSEPIADYKYHIAIENCQCRDYWTEKLADPFLGNAFPFYYGCPNIASYFPAGSYCPIDIHDVSRSVDIIEATIASGTFEKSQQVLRQAKSLVMDRYNVFAMISSVLDTKSPRRERRDMELLGLYSFTSPMQRVRRAIARVMPTKIRNKLG